MGADITVGYGGAAIVSGGTPSFSNCTFTSNTAISAFLVSVGTGGLVLTIEKMVVVLSLSPVVFQAFRTALSRATLLVRSAVMSTSMYLC
jgi:hypothetical protein